MCWIFMIMRVYYMKKRDIFSKTFNSPPLPSNISASALGSLINYLSLVHNQAQDHNESCRAHNSVHMRYRTTHLDKNPSNLCRTNQVDMLVTK